MNVGELKKLIAGVDDDVLVVMSKDAEGNNYSPLAQVDTDESTRYEAECTWSGDLIDLTEPDYNDEPRTAEDIEAIKAATVACVVLWPTN